jgi:tetratricopeptide (TPR) repeat protein
LAKAAQVKAEDNANFAREQFGLASDALYHVVTNVQQELDYKPGMQKLKEKLLWAAIPKLEQLVRSGRADEAGNDVGNSIGLAHQRLGDIFRDLGKTTQAQQHYDESHRRFVAYVAANPGSARARRNLYLSFIRLGDTAGKMGDVGARREHYRKALELAQASLEAAPRDSQALRDLSYAHFRCGHEYFDLRELKAALTDFGKAVEFARAAVEVEPQSMESKRMLADCHDSLGEALVESGDLQAALAHFREALPLHEAVETAEPENRLALAGVAKAHQDFGLVYQRLLDLPAALKHATKGVQLWERLVAADPKDAWASRTLRTAYKNLSDVHAALGNATAVRDDLRRALKLATELAAAEPYDVMAQTDLAMAYFDLGAHEMRQQSYEEAANWIDKCVALLQALQTQGKLKDEPEWQYYLAFYRAMAQASRGQQDSATDAAEKLRALDLKDPRKAFDAACIYALCASSIGPGKPSEQLTEEEMMIRKRYAERAIELLAVAAQLGCSVAQIETDLDLVGIRNQEGYRKLVASLKTPRKEK